MSPAIAFLVGVSCLEYQGFGMSLLPNSEGFQGPPNTSFNRLLVNSSVWDF